ncbi:hypothetical protein D9M68_598500 [compost metagenome]
MKKFPLNQKGIQELQVELHALSNQKLLKEIKALKSDLPEWLKDKFKLTPQQTTCIHQWNDNFRTYISIKCSISLARRVLITFTIFDFDHKEEIINRPYYQASHTDPKFLTNPPC